MQIVRDLAGYSLARSDLVRRAMAKKKHDVMKQEREVFIHGQETDGQVTVPGAIRRGGSEAVAEQLFDEMTAFSSYAFNKSHAAAYAVVAVQTGWLKCHYPIEFMAAMMNTFMGNTDKVAFYIQYLRRRGVVLADVDAESAAFQGDVHVVVDDQRHVIAGTERLERQRLPEKGVVGQILFPKLQDGGAAPEGGFRHFLQCLTAHPRPVGDGVEGHPFFIAVHTSPRPSAAARSDCRPRR